MQVTNIPKNKNRLIKAIRGLFEHRALWLYFLVDEAKKKGLDPKDYAGEAIKRCGLFQGKAHAINGPGTSLKELKKRLFAGVGQMIFEMKFLRCTDDNFDIDFHYCPLVAAWQKQGVEGQYLVDLCDFAMCGDRGMAECFGCELDLPKTIAKGDGICELRFRRKGR